ncbi:ABC-type metal ion transport system, periplasmic component/surface adhesin [Desulfosporosinus acidiphilus SJ4]|uniref:ABC-type metal ion transport system, periplasmic component/surface adhesin n=1 Tax=Desulfosporosinus acidiphilus (strain DSM 22704 / JCM 16185 / SJ4) TaxID=646529 RepID=I4D875_DESAJ|nr:metal ABC transporter substrate-binding protein [Desulfosporosinus acidiphilus]AFM41999.1 ABC-type metal ion transport system, periplasmic component/surface adhesin [Desulfosporosinus acidiphilus SJ4]
MSPKRPYVFLSLILIGLLLVSGCGSQKPAVTAQPKTVVTSISPLADLIKQVAGDKVKVINLVPAGSDPHEYEPTPSNVRQVAASSIFFANGVGEEVYLDKVVSNAANPSLRKVVLSDGLPILGKDQGGEGNPHLWLDVQNAKHYVETIRDQLSQTYPEDKQYFTQNAAAYLTKLTELDQWIRTQISSLPPESRKMVVLHDAWSYYAKQYGLTFVQPMLHTGEAEPSAKEYADLIQMIREQKVHAVFSEEGFNPKLAQQLASETGVKFIDNLHDDTLGDTPDSNSYIAMMKSNTAAIVSALK